MGEHSRDRGWGRTAQRPTPGLRQAGRKQRLESLLRVFGEAGLDLSRSSSRSRGLSGV